MTTSRRLPLPGNPARDSRAPGWFDVALLVVFVALAIVEVVGLFRVGFDERLESARGGDRRVVAGLDRVAALREQLAHEAGVRYGSGQRQYLDIFPSDRPGSPVHVFIHGGYFRALDKSQYRS